MTFLPELSGKGLRNEKYYLISIFFMLVAIKSFLTFFSYTPTVFIDEGLYDTIAQLIAQGTFFSALNIWAAFPSGYSFFLSVAYLFSEDKTVVYHIMLIINSVLSASILFPSYFILKKYIPHLQALLGAILISVLPAVTLFTFILMSENLFIPLTIFSIWFLHESFENKGVLWDFLAAISVFYLYFTRETGVVFVIALSVALAYFVLSAEKGARLKSVKGKAVLISALAIPSLAWIVYKMMTISRASFYSIEGFINIFINAFSSLSVFEELSILMLHEIDYLVLSSYVIIFIISLIIILDCLFGLNILGFKNWLEQISKVKVLALRSVILYSLTFSAGLLVISVIFLQDWGVPSIYGRYIDNIVPVIFIFGIIGIGFLSAKAEPKWISELLFCAGIAILLISLYTLPELLVNAFPNDFGIYYIIHLQNFIRNTLFMALLLAVILIFIPWYLIKNSQKDHYLIAFFSFFIVLSVILSVPIYEVRANNMAGTEQVNQIGRYLQTHSSSDTRILMDSEGPIAEQKYFRSLTQFWIKGKIIQESSAKDPSGVLTKEFVDKSDYIISKKILPYPCVIASNFTYKLYTTHINDHIKQPFSLPYVINMGSESTSCLVDGFFLSEGTYRWTREFSQVKIAYPKENGSFQIQIKTAGIRPDNNPANVTFSINDHFIGAMEKSSEISIYKAIIPEYYLENDYQILGIRTNTWRPSDYGSTDSRDLGITIEWIRLNNISFEGMYYIEYWGSIPTQWMPANATLSIFSEENRTATLAFRAISFEKPRTLNIYADDKLQTTFHILPASVTNVTAQFPLQKGENAIRLYIPEGCERPRDIPDLNNSDPRCLSIAVQNITLS